MIIGKMNSHVNEIVDFSPLTARLMTHNILE